MPANLVIFIDTSVLVALLGVPGFNQRHQEAQKEFRAYQADGAKFVIPITTIIETGNHIAQVKKDGRRDAAVRFRRAIEAAKATSPPWTIRDMKWDNEFLERLIAGDSSGSDLVEHLGSGRLGAGDIAILVERDLFSEPGECSQRQTLDIRQHVKRTCLISGRAARARRFARRSLARPESDAPRAVTAASLRDLRWGAS